MVDGCRAKFQQNRNLQEFLLNTGDTTLVEARNDSFWGAGKWQNELIENTHWSGANHLGKILMNKKRTLIRLKI